MFTNEQNLIRVGFFTFDRHFTLDSRFLSVEISGESSYSWDGKP